MLGHQVPIFSFVHRVADGVNATFSVGLKGICGSRFKMMAVSDFDFFAPAWFGRVECNSRALQH